MNEDESGEPRDVGQAADLGEPHDVGPTAAGRGAGEGIAEQVGALRPTPYADSIPGTEWGRPGPPAPLTPPSNRPLAAATVALVTIVMAGSALVALAVAPNGAGPSANRPSLPPPGAASSGPSAASPSPTPTPDPGVAIKAAFWAQVSAPDASYHVSVKGRSVFDGKTYETFSESIDVVGDEYSGTIRRTAPGPLLNAIQPSRIKLATIARKAGVVWLKEAGKHRTSRRSSARSDRMTPFMFLDLVAEVDYVKPVTINGRHLHLLRTNRYYRPDIARMLDLARFNVVPDAMALDLYVTDDGVPVKATFTVALSGNDQIGRRHTFYAQTDFTFSKVGTKLAIRVPKG